ncbi:MAG: hypothetical protein HY901_37070 [Deltaproteobacteria bacterium]|nr:hypothetical protein [Deltaproteobacteria bacterium]
MLHLLPPICRDCGKNAEQAALSPYLDFHLCLACIGKREREVLQLSGQRRRPPSKESKKETVAEEPKPRTKAKAKAKTKTTAKTTASEPKQRGGSRKNKS